MVSVLLARQGEPGLRYLDRDARTVAWRVEEACLARPPRNPANMIEVITGEFVNREEVAEHHLMRTTSMAWAGWRAPMLVELVHTCPAKSCTREPGHQSREDKAVACDSWAHPPALFLKKIASWKVNRGRSHGT